MLNSDKIDDTNYNLRIATIGNVDAGKSTFIGIIKNNDEYLDDGKGKARLSVFDHKHEKESGRTSSIKSLSIKSKYHNNDITFIDLAGHQKYLKTTIKGLNFNLNYCCLFVSANDGFQIMTRQHLIVALSLGIPIFIIITKLDIAPKNVLLNTIDKIKTFFKKKCKKHELKFIDSLDDFKKTDAYTGSELLDMSKHIDDKLIPIFKISNKTGQNLDAIKYFIHNLKPNKFYDIDKPPHFIIEKKYQIHGIGIVVSGFLKSGIIKIHDRLLMGSFNRKFYEVRIKNIHGNYRNNLSQLAAGQGGCLNIVINEKFMHRFKFGLHIIKNIKMYTRFIAKVFILHHPSTIKKGYEAILHAESISQNVKFLKFTKIDDSINYDLDNLSSLFKNNSQELLRSNDKAYVELLFKYHPEFITIDSKVIFRDGTAKGYGIIVKILE